jgi:DNA-binding XRE family transcriptional regulator
MHIHAGGRLDMAEVLEGNLLRDWRRSAGLTQAGLARQAVISRTSVSHVECGRSRPSLNLATKVCRVLSARFKRRVELWQVFPHSFRCPPGFGSAAE